VNVHVTETPSTLYVPLGRLRPGHEFPGADINMRKSYSIHDTSSLARSIQTEGILQSLLVYPHDELLFVVAGGRRLEALRLLKEDGFCGDDFMVPVIVRPDLTPADALTKSIVENASHVQPHPVDRYEAFAELKRLDMPEAEIALRHGTTERSVRQHLALGSGLCPEIRDAWREGEITVKIAEAFTLCTDLAVQAKLFAQLKKQNRLWADTIEQELRGDQEHVGHLLAAVGVKAYVDAGGQVAEDLFREVDRRDLVSDVALLKAMANDVLDRKCNALVEDGGWAWAHPAETLPRDWQHWHRSEGKFSPTAEENLSLEAFEKSLGEFQRLDDQNNGLTEDENNAAEAVQARYEALRAAILARGFTERAKKKAGCVAFINREGAVEIVHGVIRPAPEKDKKTEPADAGQTPASGEPSSTAEAAEPAKKEDEPKRIPESLAHRMSLQLTRAASIAIAAEPDFALAVLIAGLAANAQGYPVRVQHNGLGSQDLKVTDKASFETMVARFAARTVAQNLAVLADIVGAALSFETPHNGVTHPAVRNKGVAAIVDVVPGIYEALRDRFFDAEDYFSAAPKEIGLKAIAEACGDEPARALANKAKSEILKACLANVVPTGWLPPELRIKGYVPRPKDAKSAKAKKVKAKAPKSKPAKKGKRK